MTRFAIRPLLVVLVLLEFLGLFGIAYRLFQWRGIELALLAMFAGLGAALVVRRTRSGSLARWTALAVTGAAGIAAISVLQFRKVQADHLPRLGSSRLRSGGNEPIVRPFPSADDTTAGSASDIRSWKPQEGETPLNVFTRHAMFPLDRLLDAYVATRDFRHLQRAEDLVLDWVDHNSAWLIEAPSDFSWGDHSTALRLTRFLAFWNAWRESSLAGAAEATRLERSILAHGIRLADSAFYTPRHNHGIDQDLALSQLATMVDGPLGEAWYGIARARLLRTLADVIAPSGIMREHSPGYGLSTLEHLTGFREFLRATGRQDDAEAVEEWTARMRAAAVEFVEPSGLVVPFGDTRADLRLPSGIQFPEPQGPRLRPYLEDGYAFVREAPEEPGAPPWFLAVTAASNLGFAHKHCDDLSFVLSNGTRRLFVDPGTEQYRLDEWRRYFLSCDAHNTVSTGGVFQYGSYFPLGTAGASLTYAEDRGTHVLISGTRKLDRRGRHDRTWVWIPGHSLIVADRITGRARDLQVTFHLGPGLVTKQADSGLQIVTESGTVVARALAHGRPGAWQVTRGSIQPIQGWITTGLDRRIPADVIALADTARPAVFVTEFLFARGASAVSEVRARSDGTTLVLRSGTAQWTVYQSQANPP